MTLRNNLYTVTSGQVNDNSAHFELELNADHLIYKAHFPDMPITPGVCLLQIAKELLEDCCGQSLEIGHIKNVKFLAPMSPTELPRIVVTLDHIVSDGTYTECRAQILSPDDKVLTKLSFKCIVSE